MSFMFEHWFEDEYENITKGEVSFLQRENEELKRRVKELEEGIEPGRKTGKWNAYYRMYSGDTFACNRCGSCFVVLQGADKMNFCPNCGAEMEKYEYER